MQYNDNVSYFYELGIFMTVRMSSLWYMFKRFSYLPRTDIIVVSSWTLITNSHEKLSCLQILNFFHPGSGIICY